MKRVERLKKRKTEKSNWIIFLLLISIFVVTFNSRMVNANTDERSRGYEKINVEWSRTPEPDKGQNNPLNLHAVKENEYWHREGNNYLLKKEVDENYIGSTMILPSIIWGNNGGRNDIVYDYKSMIGLLNPTQTSNVWDGRGDMYYDGYINKDQLDGYGVKDFYTWRSFKDGADSWRMFRGEFELTDFNPKTQDVYLAVLGENGPQLVMPVNDFMMVMIDGKPTKINYGTQRAELNKNKMKFQFAEGGIAEIDFYTAYHSAQNSTKRCQQKLHSDVSRHTDTWHVHLDETVDGRNIENSDGNALIGNISQYLDGYNNEDNNSIKKSHKIEVFGIDNTGGGGGTKFDVFVVDKPKIEVEKTGYIKDKNGKEVALKKDGSSIVDIGKDVFYEFKIKNDMKDTVTDIEFEDDLVGIKINSTGIYKRGADGEYNINPIENEVEIIKTTSLGEEIDEGTNQFQKFNTLNPGEVITIRDNINMKYFVTVNDAHIGAVKNIVVGRAKYFNSTLTGTDDAEFVVKVEDIKPENIKISIKKDIQKVIRNGKEIFNKDNTSNMDEYSKKLMPGDEVSFDFKIVNSSKKDEEEIAVDSLNLTDILSDSNYITPDWKYMCKEIENFNAENFLIKAGQTLNVSAEGWIVPEPKEDWSYDVTNTVSLYRKDKNGENHELGRSRVELKILFPSINIKKVVINKEGVVPDIDKLFTLSLNWNGNKLKRTVEAIPEKEYAILNLKYGVKYKLEELVPMNYELVDIEATRLDGMKIGIKENSNSSSWFQLGSGLESIDVDNLNGATIAVTNKKVNDTLFFDESIERNIFTYKKDGIEIDKSKAGVMK